MIVVSDVIQTEPRLGPRNGNSAVYDPYNGPYYMSVCLDEMIGRLTFGYTVFSIHWQLIPR